MAGPTAVGLSHLFTELIGRPVHFKPSTSAGAAIAAQIYGLYAILPDHAAIVVKADLALLCSFGGVLVGLPDGAVKERTKAGPLDELLRDAVHEVLNVAATLVTTYGRAVFQKMLTDVAYIDGAAALMLKKPDHKSYFDVTVDGYQGGKFAIFAPFAPVQVVNG